MGLCKSLRELSTHGKIHLATKKQQTFSGDFSVATKKVVTECTLLVATKKVVTESILSVATKGCFQWRHFVATEVGVTTYYLYSKIFKN